MAGQDHCDTETMPAPREKRKGNYRGRPKGSLNVRTKLAQDMAAEAQRLLPGLLQGPFETAQAFLRRVMNTPAVPLQFRLDAARAVIRTEVPNLSAVANINADDKSLAERLLRAQQRAGLRPTIAGEVQTIEGEAVAAVEAPPAAAKPDLAPTAILPPAAPISEEQRRQNREGYQRLLARKEAERLEQLDAFRAGILARFEAGHGPGNLLPPDLDADGDADFEGLI